MEKIGGRFGVEDNAGGGAIFWIDFQDVSTAPEQARRSRKTANESSQKLLADKTNASVDSKNSVRAIVVDDSTSVCSILASILAKNGMDNVQSTLS